VSAGHTPGPWRFDEFQRVTGFAVSGCGLHGGLLALAYIKKKGPYTLVALGVAEAKANARLIAAAPELLAALQTLMGSIEGLQENLDAAKAARAAIAKATGEAT
jgi:hypothetical protein